MRLINLVGQRFGRLKVLELITGHKRPQYLCRCDCGAEKIIHGQSLSAGNTLSCGCLRKEVASKTLTTHGLSKTYTYSFWISIKRRCYNKNTKDYPLYGGRGIKVSLDWVQDYTKFLADMGPCPGKGFSIERIDSNKDYTKDNCKWATAKEQANNTSRNRMLTYKGQTKSLTLLAEEYGLSPKCLHARLFKSGFSLEEALTKPLKHDKTRKPLSPKSLLETA